MTTTVVKTLSPEAQELLDAAPTFALFLEGAKKPLPLKPAISKAGNVFWALPGQTSRGLAISPRSKNLPTKVTIAPALVNENGKYGGRGEGEDVSLTLKKIVLTDDDGKARPAVEYGPVKTVLPTGEAKMVRFIFSIRKDGNWNVKASAFGTGGGVHLADEELDF